MLHLVIQEGNKNMGYLYQIALKQKLSLREATAGCCTACTQKLTQLYSRKTFQQLCRIPSGRLQGSCKPSLPWHWIAILVLRCHHIVKTCWHLLDKSIALKVQNKVTEKEQVGNKVMAFLSFLNKHREINKFKKSIKSLVLKDL